MDVVLQYTEFLINQGAGNSFFMMLNVTQYSLKLGFVKKKMVITWSLVLELRNSFPPQPSAPNQEISPKALLQQ